MRNWILIADVSQARLFVTERREDTWTLIQLIEHPEGRLTSREIRPSSPPGHAKQSKAPSARHTALEPHTSPKEAETERFAEDLAAFLEQAVHHNAFDTLFLVAPPHFLGLLRLCLHPQIEKRVRAVVNKDYVALTPAELRERLIDIVFPLSPARP